MCFPKQNHQKNHIFLLYRKAEDWFSWWQYFYHILNDIFYFTKSGSIFQNSLSFFSFFLRKGCGWMWIICITNHRIQVLALLVLRLFDFKVMHILNYSYIIPNYWYKKKWALKLASEVIRTNISLNPNLARIMDCIWVCVSQQKDPIYIVFELYNEDGTYPFLSSKVLIYSFNRACLGNYETRDHLTGILIFNTWMSLLRVVCCYKLVPTN